MIFFLFFVLYVEMVSFQFQFRLHLVLTHRNMISSSGLDFQRFLKVENKNGLFDLIFGFYGLCQLFTIFILFDWLLLKLVQLGFKVKTK